MRALTAVLASVILAACATLIPPEPKTTVESLAVVYAGISVAAVTVKTRMDAGAIPPDQAANILAVLDNADAIADTGRAVVESCRAQAPQDKAQLTTCESGADIYVGIAADILAQIEARLRAGQGAK